jgi:plastocyanin
MKRIPLLVVLVSGVLTLARAGDITGKVSFSGTAPKQERLRMNADPVCMKAHKDAVFGEAVVVNKNGTLKNVLIYVKDGLGNRKFTPPATKAEFDQEGCRYSPHVLGIQVGQDLYVKNSDKTLHNVHTLSKDNSPFNIAQIPNGSATKKFDKVETFKVKCDVHPWMNAYIGVFSHPFYAVTGDDGTFSLKKLPAGEYTIEAWHETFGVRTMKVKVAESGEVKSDFSYAAK